MITLLYNILFSFHRLVVKIVGFVEVDRDHSHMGSGILLAGNLLHFREAY
jgi:hypothetical protein